MIGLDCMCCIVLCCISVAAGESAADRWKSRDQAPVRVLMMIVMVKMMVMVMMMMRMIPTGAAVWDQVPARAAEIRLLLSHLIAILSHLIDYYYHIQ